MRIKVSDEDGDVKIIPSNKELFLSQGLIEGISDVKLIYNIKQLPTLVVTFIDFDVDITEKLINTTRKNK